MTTHDATTSTGTVGTHETRPLSEEEVGRLDADWQAANYLSVGQIYLLDNAGVIYGRNIWPGDHGESLRFTAKIADIRTRYPTTVEAAA